MQISRRRWAGLVALSSGALVTGTCDAIVQTIGFAFNIVDIWV
jgi:hypothetical protein